jgi:hypothetical protein
VGILKLADPKWSPVELRSDDSTSDQRNRGAGGRIRTDDLLFTSSRPSRHEAQNASISFKFFGYMRTILFSDCYRKFRGD